MATRLASVPTRHSVGLTVVEKADGFLGRWARRKTDVRQGKPLEEPLVDAKPAPVIAAAAPSSVPPESASMAVSPDAAAGQPLLSLEDVKLLTKDSDFKPFMAQSVGPEVRNAAMKKLFADPHFNVMDGLDIYIDDYSKSDPIPESMLRQMASAKFLKLFDDVDDDDAEKQNEAAAALRDNATNAPVETVAQSGQNASDAAAEPASSDPSSQPGSLHDSGASQKDHAYTDLRLQPDHAAAGPDAGRGAS